jgi:hypothetical protein
MPTITQVTHKQVQEGPITRSRAKLFQKEVNSFLAETNFNIHENIILPKNSTLILLRYTHEEVEDTWSMNQDTVPLSHRCDEDGLSGQPGIKLISPSTLSLDSQNL